MKKITKNLKSLIVLFGFFLCSATSIAQVDLIASVNDANPPLSIGQNFTYVLVAEASENYRGIQVTLDYDPAIIEAVSVTPIYIFGTTFANNIDNINGKIEYAGGDITGNINGTETIFEIVFNVVGNSSGFTISHIFTGTLGTGVTNAAGQNVLGTTNTIFFETLNITNEDFTNSISFYPNPVNDVLNIKLNTSHSEIDNIKIFSIEGKLIQVHNTLNVINNLLKIDTSKLDQAMYFVTITSVKNEIATFKILINQ